jgi:hypothetical protein
VALAHKTFRAKTVHGRTAKVCLWALVVSAGVHLAALTALGAVHFCRRTDTTAGARPADVSIHTIERIIEQPASKPKPKIEPQVEPVIQTVVPEPVEAVEPTQPKADNAAMPLPMHVQPDPTGLFFGQGVKAQSVCYVVDGSGSMLGLMYLVREQLRESILNLSGQQSFNVLFFMQGGVLLQSFEGRMERATPAAKAEALNLLARVCPQGQTSAKQAIETAFRFRDRTGKVPEVIYFLTDGFDLMEGGNDAFVQQVRNLKNTLAPASIVHTIGIYPEAKDRTILSELAAACGGRYIEAN